MGKGKLGYGLFATRKIKKGKMIMDDNSLDYSFSDVVDGDMLLLDRSKKASNSSNEDIPQYLPVTRDMLLRTHGVPCLYPDPTDESSAGIIRWRLEVPGMLINHSCDPTTIDYPPNAETGEGYAARKIGKGEELTFDYCLQYCDHGPFFEKCECGTEKCRGSMMGFKALAEEDKKRLFPAATKAVQAMYLADIGKGPPVKMEQLTFPPRQQDSSVPRLVVPPPSSALAQLELKPNDDDEGTFALYSLKDFQAGQEMYEFWNQTWPDGFPQELDMVFGASVIDSHDPPEGTVIRINASTVVPKSKGGYNLFSAWQLLAQHSCDPNTVYDDDDELSDCGSDDEGYWWSVTAAKDIKAGDLITVDCNNLLWDRTEADQGIDACHCGAETCTGSVQGFKFLSPEEQEKRKNMTWLRVPFPQNESKKKADPGEALSKHVRAMWRQDPQLKTTAPAESDSDSDSSSSTND